MYTDQTQVEAYLKRTLDENEALLIDDIIDTVSVFIDDYTNRHWLPVGEEIDPYTGSYALTFDGNGTKRLYIDDFAELEMIEILDYAGNVMYEITDTDQWLLYPLNQASKSQVELRNYVFPSGSANVRITAVWGSGKCPKGVSYVCAALVGKYIQRNSANSGVYKSENIEGYSYQLMTSQDIDADMNTIIQGLNKYKKYVL